MCIRWLRCSRRTGSWKGGRLRGSCCCCRLRDARLGEDSSRAAAAQEGPGRQSGVLRWKATESRREATCVRTHRPVPSLRDSRLQLAYPALTCRAFLFRRFAASDRASLNFLYLAGVVLQVRGQILLAAVVADWRARIHL